MKTHGEVVTVDAARVRPFPGQPREYFDADALISLEVSIKQRGQIQPGLVREIEGDRDHDFELVDGQRRWHACLRLGVPFCAVVIDPADENEQYEISVAANFQRADHTPIEIAKAINRLYAAGRSEVYIGTLFGKSSFWVNGYKRLTGLIPELACLLDPAETPSRDDRMPVTLALQLCRLEPHEQKSEFKRIQEHGIRSVAATEGIRQRLRETGEIQGRKKKPSEYSDALTNFMDRTVRSAKDPGHRPRLHQVQALLPGQEMKVDDKSQVEDTLLEVQLEYQRLERENAHLKAELNYEAGWRAKYEEQLERMR